MPRPKSVTLTTAELRLMEVLWKLGKSTVSEVADVLAEQRDKLAYSSVLTTMRILEQKGYVKHEQSGRAFVYEPRVKRQEAQRSALGHLLERLFEGDPKLLMQNLVDTGELTDDDRAALRKLLATPKKGDVR